MRTRLIIASVSAAFLSALASDSTMGLQPKRTAAPRESRIPLGKASLYSREIGWGQPIIVLHGGPDFDHGYLLPDLDRLADAFRLIYYDSGDVEDPRTKCFLTKSRSRLRSRISTG